MPVSRIIDGLTVTEELAALACTNHSGLAVFGSYPSKVRSSLGIWLSLSAYSDWKQSVFTSISSSTNIVGS
jgi:hypothetical protein